MIDNKICVLVVDDEVKMTRALCDFLRIKKYMVLTANNGEKALKVYYENNEKIDIVLLDIMMPKIDGLEVLREIRGNGDDVPIIMLTAKSEEYDEIEGLKTGADDYLRKPFSPNVLVVRIETLLNRVMKKNNEDLVVGDIKINLKSYTVIIEDKKIEFTRKEFDLLYYLIVNANIVVSRDMILDSVWGYNYEGDIRTVDTHIKQIRIKLSDRGSYIKTVHRVGYVFEK